MTITIFEKDDYCGDSRVINGDVPDLKGQRADKPGSIKLTGSDEAVLLFKNDDWHGGALYIRGPKNVADLGKDKEGGRFGFGNSIRSIRLTPFDIELNVNVVKSGKNLPGSWPDEQAAEIAVRDIVRRANDFLDDQRALLRFVIARVEFRNDPKQFNLSGLEGWSFPGAWKMKHEIDVIFVNRFDKESQSGLGKFPCFGKCVVVGVTINDDGGPDYERTNDAMAGTLVHEVGHYLGVTHNTSNDKVDNFMAPIGAAALTDRSMFIDQVREMHDRLANHHTRRGDRND